MKKSLRLAVAAAVGALSLALTGSALAAFTPRLVVTGHPNAGAGGALTIAVEVAATDDPTARVTIYIPNGYQVEAPAAGAKLGTVTATAQAVDLGNAVLPLTGDLLVATSTAQFAPQQLACLGPTPAQQTWYLHLTAAGQTLDIPMFLVASTGVETVFSAQKIVVCLPPPDVPVGTPGRATFGAKLLTATFTNASITNPSATGEYRWRSLWTPYTPATGRPNAAGSVEAQSAVRLPTQLTQRVTKKRVIRRVKGKRQVWWAVTLTGRLTENQAGIGTQRVTVTAGTTRTRRSTLRTVTTNASGAFTVRATVRSPQYFQSRATLPRRDLGSAGCTATFGVPCVSAHVGAYTLVSAFARV